MKEENKSEIQWHTHKVRQEDREGLLGQKSFLIWFTGLPGSGKSTIASALEYKLNKSGYLTYLLDGDNVRHGLNSDIGFSISDREENIRRIGHVANLMVDAGVIVLAAFISPFKKDRMFARSLVGNKRFIEIFVDCSLEKCIERDPKGLYKKALKNKIPEFTGISSPYERPENPEIIVNTTQNDKKYLTQYILDYLINKNFISKR